MAERIPIKNPKTEGDVGTGAFSFRVANGETDRATPTGPVLPADTLTAYLTPYQWYADKSFCKSLPQEMIPDVGAWVAGIDPAYRAAAAARVEAIGAAVLWLQRLYLAAKDPARFDPPAVG